MVKAHLVQIPFHALVITAFSPTGIAGPSYSCLSFQSSEYGVITNDVSEYMASSMKKLRFLGHWDELQWQYVVVTKMSSGSVAGTTCTAKY